MRFDRLAERQILKARASGALDNLKGAGEPLPPDTGADAATAAGFRMMAEAGALPGEIGLRKQIEARRRDLAAVTDAEARKTLLAELADLEMRLAIEEEIRRRTFG